MPRKPRPEIVDFRDAYQVDIRNRVRDMTRATAWSQRRSDEIVGTRHIPLTGMSVAAYNQLYRETHQEYDEVAVLGLCRYCKVDAAQRALMRLIIRGNDGVDFDSSNVADIPVNGPDSLPVAGPHDSLMDRYNLMFMQGLVEESRELELNAVAAGRNIQKVGVDIWTVEMPARAEAALFKTIAETSVADNETINKAIQTYYMLHMFEQVAEVHMTGPDDVYIPLRDFDLP